jgi:hypothetical protein
LCGRISSFQGPTLLPNYTASQTKRPGNEYQRSIEIFVKKDIVKRRCREILYVFKTIGGHISDKKNSDLFAKR